MTLRGYAKANGELTGENPSLQRGGTDLQGVAPQSCPPTPADVAATEWLVPNLAQDLSQALMAFRLLRAEIVEFDEHKFGDRGPISGEDMLRWERESKEGADLISRSVKALLDLTPRRVR